VLALTINNGDALPAATANYHPNAAIGDVPNEWIPDIDEYSLVDILRLIIFYNDGFGINANDTVNAKKRKVLEWLTGTE
jgi:hypothetical protein